MAGELNIRFGTRIQVAYDVPFGQVPDFNMICTFIKQLDESAFLISVPMGGGKQIPMDDSKKLLMRTGIGENAVILAGFADDVVKEGIHTYWKIRRVMEQRTFFKRADERVKVSMRAKYLQEDWPRGEDGEIRKDDAITMDISAGGAAIFINRRFEVGEICKLFLPAVGSEEGGHERGNIVSVVCWLREAPKGGSYRFVCGLQFRFADALERDDLKEYVTCVKKAYKLRVA